jgi:hypothetical protein
MARLAGSMFIVNAVTVSAICLISRVMRSSSAPPRLFTATDATNRSMAASIPLASVAMRPLSLPSTHSSICSARSVEGMAQMLLPCERRPEQV